MVTEHAEWSGRDGHCTVMLHNAIFLLGGTDDPYFCKNDVWKSEDGGRSWIELCYMAPWPERWQHAACVNNGFMYISGGWGSEFLNDIWKSEDGINWTYVCSNCPWRTRMFHSMISFNGALYVL